MESITISQEVFDSFVQFVCHFVYGSFALCAFLFLFYQIFDSILLNRRVQREFKKNKEKYINDYLDRHPKLFDGINE